jgi:DNA repair exonuclease SbcCD ATPase subunit
MDDEHKLIARYAAKLAGRTVYSQPYSSHGLSSGRLTNGRHSMADERALIASLEEENTEMLRELSILEQQQLDLADDTTGQLKDLRTRTSELENRMREKQHLRRELMTQLEQLMTQLNSPLISEDHLARMYNLGMTSSTIPTAGVLMTDYNATGVPATHAQLQESLLHAADDITTKVAKLVQELDMEDESKSFVCPQVFKSVKL